MESAGDILQYAIPAYAFALSLWDGDYDGTKQFFYTLGSSQLTVHSLKFATKEKRPNYTEGRRKDSFPSGHTSSAFVGASFIHRRYGFSHAIIPYGLAIFTDYSRVHARKHYLHDVLAGAAISIICTWIFVDEKSNIAVTSDESGTMVAYEVSF
ncbi:MAG: phosphatase PAP2 family protein [Puniceicoccales bacterium]|nr:phosphatase PAP2 family protein [Puniceicoccales bacterium]